MGLRQTSGNPLLKLKSIPSESLPGCCRGQLLCGSYNSFRSFYMTGVVTAILGTSANVLRLSVGRSCRFSLVKIEQNWVLKTSAIPLALEARRTMFWKGLARKASRRMEFI